MDDIIASINMVSQGTETAFSPEKERGGFTSNNKVRYSQTNSHRWQKAIILKIYFISQHHNKVTSGDKWQHYPMAITYVILNVN